MLETYLRADRTQEIRTTLTETFCHIRIKNWYKKPLYVHEYLYTSFLPFSWCGMPVQGRETERLRYRSFLLSLWSNMKIFRLILPTKISSRGVNKLFHTFFFPSTHRYSFKSLKMHCWRLKIFVKSFPWGKEVYPKTNVNKTIRSTWTNLKLSLGNPNILNKQQYSVLSGSKTVGTVSKLPVQMWELEIVVKIVWQMNVISTNFFTCAQEDSIYGTLKKCSCGSEVFWVRSAFALHNCKI